MPRDKLLWRAMSADEGRGYMSGVSKQKQLADDVFDLSAYQHVSFGNTHTKSLYFSASLKMDPSIFWSTRTLNERLMTCPSRGHNWDRVGIALLNRDLCHVKYDVSDGMRAVMNGLNNVMIGPDENGQFRSDQRVFGLATSNHEVILRRVEASACISFYTVKELCLWGLWQWGEDDNVPKDLQLDRWCSYERWGSRSKQYVVPGDWLDLLPR